MFRTSTSHSSTCNFPCFVVCLLSIAIVICLRRLSTTKRSTCVSSMCLLGPALILVVYSIIALSWTWSTHLPLRVEFLLPLAALSLSLFQRACTYTVVLVYFAQSAMVSSFIFHLSSIPCLIYPAMHSLSINSIKVQVRAVPSAAWFRDRMVRASRTVQFHMIKSMLLRLTRVLSLPPILPTTIWHVSLIQRPHSRGYRRWRRSREGVSIGNK